jgi:biotin operon repressor
MTTNTTTMSMSQRKFGIEIECYGISISEGVAAIKNSGIGCHYEDYGHSVPYEWKVVTDASVSNGFEVVSPPLSGENGLEQVRKVSKALIDAGAKVDKRCGFHVHVDANDLTKKDMINIIRRYGKFEEEIDSWMPVSRRADNNHQYCASLKNACSNLEYFWSNSTNRSGYTPEERYSKVNLHAYVRHGTVEFRQHSGTVEARKMIPWILWCINFVESSKMVTTPALRSSVSSSNGSSNTGLRKNSIVKKYLELAKILNHCVDSNNHMSAKEFAEKIGITEESVPCYISQFRNKYGILVKAVRGLGYYSPDTRDLVRVVCEKEGITNPFNDPDYIYGNVITTTSVQPPEEKGVLHGLPQEVISYFQERMMELSPVIL